MISLSEQETIALYCFVKAREEEIGTSLIPLLTRIERQLYEYMSIEEVENLSRADRRRERGETHNG